MSFSRYSLFCALFIVLASIPLAESYGTVFVDKVVPVKSDSVYFSDTTSEFITTRVLDVGSVSLSDPAGFNVNIPLPIDIKSGDGLNIRGDLGLGFGNLNAPAVLVNVTGAVDFQSEDFFALFSQINFNINPDTYGENPASTIDLMSGRYATLFAEGVVDFATNARITLQSVRGKASARAPTIIGTGRDVNMFGEQSVLMASRTGFVDWTARDLGITADTIHLFSEQNTEFVADGSLFINAEDTVDVTAGRYELTTLGDIGLQSDRNIDIDSPSGFFMQADYIDLRSSSQFYIKATEEGVSQITFLAQDQVSVKSTNGLINSGDVQLEADRTFSLISNQMNMDSAGVTSIGNAETDAVHFNAGRNTVGFSLGGAGSAGLNFAAATVRYNATDDISLSSDNFRASTGSGFLLAQGALGVSATDITLEATSEMGEVLVNTRTGQTFTATGALTVGAREAVFDAMTKLSATGSGVDMFFATRVSVLADTSLNARAGNQLSIDSGNLLISGNTTVTLNSENNAAVAMTFSAGQSFNYYVNDEFVTKSADDTTVKVGGDMDFFIEGLLNIVGDQSVDWDVEDDAFFYNDGDDMPFLAQRDIIFSNLQETNVADDDSNDDDTDGTGVAGDPNGAADDDDFMSFAFVRDIDFTAPTFTANVTRDLLFNAGQNIIINSLQDSNLSVEDFSIVTSGTGSASGVNIDTVTGPITVSSGGATAFGGNNVKFTAEDFQFTTPEILASAVRRFDLIGQSLNILAREDFDIASSGSVILTANDRLRIATTNGPLEFSARDSVNMTATQQVLWQASNVTSIDARNAEFHTRSFDLAAQGPLTFDTAGVYEQEIRIISGDDITFTAGGSTRFTAGVLNSFENSGDLFLRAGGEDLIMNYDTIEFTGVAFNNLVGGNYNLTAGGNIQYVSNEFESVFSVETSPLEYLTERTAVFTSEGPLTFNLPGSPFTATADSKLTFIGDDSISLSTTGGDFAVTNGAAGQSIAIDAGGRTALIAETGGAALTSASTIDVTAGRIIADAYTLGPNQVGASFLAQKDDIVVRTTNGSAIFDIANAVRLEATNQNATASHLFTSSNGVHLVTQRGGQYYLSTGFLPGGQNGFEFLSTANRADIIFESRLGGQNLTTLNDITYDAGRHITLTAAYGATFTPDTNMTWSAPEGSFSVTGQRGVNITAGTGPDPGDLLFSQKQGAFYVTAGDRIQLYSGGDVPAESILVTGKSDIRFQTTNTGDISFVASDDLFFDVGGYFDLKATNDIELVSRAGSVSVDAVDGADFRTLDGPIFFKSFTSGEDGATTLTAQTGDISLTSGNSTYLTAKQTASYLAASGVLVDSDDGSLDIYAASANSFINILSAGGLQVRSGGNDLYPDEGIILDSANNIQYGTVDTQLIAFNPVDEFTVGTDTRPLIFFNAGGSASKFGYTIVSDGGVRTITQSDFITDIGKSWLVDAKLGITARTYGDTTLATIGTEGINFNSNVGTLRLYGANQQKLTSDTDIQGTSGGILEIFAKGTKFGDEIRFVAPAVKIFSGDHQLMANTLDADLTTSFTLTTTGSGVFEGSLDESSNIVFSAAQSFSGVSAGQLTAATSETNAPLSFVTAKNSSDITFITDVQSDMEYDAGGEFGVFADSFSWTSFDLTITAFQTDRNDNRRLGDIRIDAANSLSTFSEEILSVVGEETITIETFASADDVGGPLSLTATSAITFDSTMDQLIQNIAGQNGSISFQALSDITIDSANPDAWVNFDAGNEFRQSSLRDNILLVGGTRELFVGQDMIVTTRGIDPNDDFGVQVKTLNEDIDFEAMFGAVRFSSTNNDATLQSVDGDIGITSDGDGTLTAVTGVSVVANEDAQFNAQRGSIEMYGQDGIRYGASTSMSFSAGGVDDSSRYSIRFQADSPAPMQMDFVGDINAFGQEFYGEAKNIVVTSQNLIGDSSFGDILMETDGLYKVQADDFDFNVDRLFRAEGGTFDINSEADINFDTPVDMIIQTTGYDSNLDFFASGTVTNTANHISIRTERRPTADVNIQSFLGRMQFNGDPNFQADFGDLIVQAQGDDSDIYINSQDVTLTTAGSMIFSSSLIEPTVSGVRVQTSGGQSYRVQTSTRTRAGVDFNMNAGGQLSLGALPFVGNRESPYEGGTTLARALNNVNIQGTDVEMRTAAANGDVFMSTETGDIIFNADVIINDDGVMKIPRHLNPDDDSNSANTQACVPGAFFWYDRLEDEPVTGTTFDGYNTYGFLCVCRNNGNLRCARFSEPPCAGDNAGNGDGPNCSNNLRL